MERAMSTMSLDITIVRHASPWGQVKRSLAEWRRRARTRNELMNLDYRMLQDVGISRATADFEASKPFWMD
jgi:uncharacterized protein YjiS (DUF1127 family)